MYYLKRWLLRKVFKLLRKTPDSMPMVKYWKTKEMVAAKVMRNKEGSYEMQMEGEDEPFPGFPRGHLLFGTLSKLKHEIKNQIFNDSWALLEQGADRQAVIDRVKYQILTNIKELVRLSRYDMVPPSKMCRPVKEIYRAWTTVQNSYEGAWSEELNALKLALTYILQEDDAYRFRMQWLVSVFRPFRFFFGNPVSTFRMAMKELKHGEIVGDMKSRMVLFERIVSLMLEDKTINRLFREFAKEIDWNKLKLTKADKYHFRAKWFKVDLDKFEY